MNYAQASELDGKLQKIVNNLNRSISEKSPGLSQATLAVFPASADEKLIKKRVDLAVSELLTQQLLKQTKFHLVERSDIDKVLAEQKLGLSGAIDSATAARVGRLLGSRLALMSSVSRLGKSYQITSKIVENETAEVLAIDSEEISIETFDEEANRYLVLVPQKQVIGVFGVVGGPMINGSAFEQTFHWEPSGNQPYTTIFDNIGMQTDQHIGVGMKYFMYKSFFFEGIIYPATISKSGNIVVRIPERSNSWAYAYNLSQGLTWQLSINDMIKLRKNFNLSVGLGVLQVPLKVDVPSYMRSFEETVNLNVLNAGLEWRPQERLGIGLTAQYIMGDSRPLGMQYGDSINGYKNLDIFRPNTNSVTINYVITLYF